MANLIAQGFNAIARIAVIIILARLLNPNDFGMMAMVASTFGILSMFKDFGLSTATVQRTEVSEQQLSVLFWINVLVGCLLATITLISAWPAAMFYREPRLVTLCAAFAATFILEASGIQHAALLQRQMRFSALALIDSASLIASSILGVVLALLGTGYWALFGMTACNMGVRAGCVWAASGWRPGRPRWSKEVAAIVHTGGLVTANGVVMHVAHNLDKVLLGRSFGAESLGLYSRAQQLVTFPTDVVNSAISGVLLSALSRVKDDPVRLRNYFLKSYSLLVALTTPIAVVLAVFATEIVEILLGPKWVGCIPVFRALAPTVLLYGALSPMYPLLIAVNMAGRSLRMALVLGPVMIIGYLSGMHWGPTGAAVGLSISLAIWTVPHMAWTVHGTPVKLGEALRAVGLPLIAAMIAIVPAVLIQAILPEESSPVWKLGAALPAFAVVYAFTLLVGMKQWPLMKDVVTTLRRRDYRSDHADANP